MKIDCAYDELVELNKLIPNPKNANTHSESQIKRLADIISFQGQRSPIVISKRSGFIVKGHARLGAIKLLGWEKAAVDYQDYESDAQEYADIIADNEIARWAELNVEQLKLDLNGLPDLNIDLLGLQNFTILPLEDLEEVEKREGEQKFVLEVTFPNDCELNDIKDELLSRGYIVKVK